MSGKWKFRRGRRWWAFWLMIVALVIYLVIVAVQYFAGV